MAVAEEGPLGEVLASLRPFWEEEGPPSLSIPSLPAEAAEAAAEGGGGGQVYVWTWVSKGGERDASYGLSF